MDNYPDPRNHLNGCLADARNTVAAFKAQQGTIFGKVHDEILLDGAATWVGILGKWQAYPKVGAAGDYFVLFLSGHGARQDGGKTWFFLPYDSAHLTDKQILDTGDILVKQKKIVVIIVDACHCGQMETTAQPYFNHYKTPRQGGMILMLSSRGDQLSAGSPGFGLL